MSQKNCKALVPLLFQQGYQKTPALNTDDRETGFLDLPFEIRKDIYVRDLRPDCNLFNPNERHLHTYNLKCEKHHQHPETFLGCTNLLMTCSQVYREAIELLHQGEVLLRLNHEQKKAVRDSKAFGKPGYFQEGPIDFFTFASRDKPALPQPFDQLQLTRRRKLVLFIDFPSEDSDRLRIHYDSRPHPIDNWLIRVGNKVREIAPVVSKSHALETVRIILHRCNDGPGQGAVVKRTPEKHSAALQDCLSPVIDAAARAGFTLVLDEFYDTVRARSRVPHLLCHLPHLGRARRTPGRDSLAQEGVRQETWNQLHPSARFGTADFKCWTCARPFWSSNHRRWHTVFCRHKRLRVVVRYREDNRGAPLAYGEAAEDSLGIPSGDG